MKHTSYRKIALERIGILFGLAHKRFKEYPEYSDRYVGLARRISMRSNVPIPAGLKRRLCRRCGSYLSSGSNATVRTKPEQKAVIISCKKCGNVSRYPYRREKKLGKAEIQKI